MQVAKHFDAIIDFAELEEFVDSPLRTYSTGMQMRLGFAIAVHVSPDILLIDEALSVGDISFQRKCIERIEKIKSDGCTILLVSHDPALISEQCDEAIWLRGGRLAAYGPAVQIADQYLEGQKNETERRTPREWPVQVTSAGTELQFNENRVGSMEMEITDVRLLDQLGETLAEIDCGAGMLLEITYDAHETIEQPIFAVNLMLENEQMVFETSYQVDGLVLPHIPGKKKLILEIARLDLKRG